MWRSVQRVRGSEALLLFERKGGALDLGVGGAGDPCRPRTTQTRVGVRGRQSTADGDADLARPGLPRPAGSAEGCDWGRPPVPFALPLAWSRPSTAIAATAFGDGVHGVDGGGGGGGGGGGDAKKEEKKEEEEEEEDDDMGFSLFD